MRLGSIMLGIALILAVAGTVAGCGLNVQSADLFVLTRTGAGHTLTLLVNDGGTIRCNGAKSKPINDSTLINARDLSDNLAGDASKHLTIPPVAGQVYYFRIRLQQGTVAFPDRAAHGRKVLAQAELFATQTAVTDCGLSG